MELGFFNILQCIHPLFFCAWSCHIRHARGMPMVKDGETSSMKLVGSALADFDGLPKYWLELDAALVAKVEHDGLNQSLPPPLLQPSS